MLYWLTFLQAILALFPSSLSVLSLNKTIEQTRSLPLPESLTIVIPETRLNAPTRSQASDLSARPKTFIAFTHAKPKNSFNFFVTPLTATHDSTTLTAHSQAVLPKQSLTLAQVGATFVLGSTAIGIVGIVILFLIGFWAYTRVYQITPNNEAFVRTGGFLAKKNTVILYGGCIVLPGFHELTRVPMREITIDVERTGNLAVRTQDYLRANMRVTFYVCVNHDEQDVKTAAARLSKDGSISPVHIKEALEKRADDAIRAAAKRKTLAEIDSDKLGFADEVLNLIQQDLKKVGLTLNNIAISEIEESDTYDTNNFFDAQGVKLRTETIQKAIQQKEEVELTTEQERRNFQLETQLKIKQQEIEARKKELSLEEEQEDAQLQQQLKVEALRAQRAREIQEAKDTEAANQERTRILQETAIEEEQIRKKQSLQESQIASDIALEEEQKKLNITKTQQQQETEMAEILRRQAIEAGKFAAAVEIAEARKLSEVAKQMAEIAIAEKEKERLAAEALRARAEAAVVTATSLEQAEREQQLAAIEAEREAAKQRISDNNIVEIEVFRRRRQAEIARQAAELEAESIRTLAEANREKGLAEAEAEEAKVRANNLISNATLTADLIQALMPQLIEKLPEIMQALAPQPGVLGDAKIYSFPGASGANNGTNSADEIGKLMLSTSGLSLLSSILEDGTLVNWINMAVSALNQGGSVDQAVPEALKSLETMAQEKNAKLSTESLTESPTTSTQTSGVLITPPPADPKAPPA